MTASEFAFLALGLVLGVATGAAVVVVFRARPRPPREVRVTVTAASVPRRSSTLAAAALDATAGEGASGGPADASDGSAAEPPSLPAGASAERRGPFVLEPRPPARRYPVAIPVGPGREPSLMVEALHAAEARASAILGGGRGDVGSSGGAGPSSAAVALADQPGSPGAPAAPSEPPGSSNAGGSGAAGPEGPCLELRRVADERCALATTATERAAATAAALRDLQRIYDEHQARADRAAVAGDPVRIRATKEAAQQAFRRARDAARTRAQLEEAARAWLAEINAINGATRGSAETAARERAAAVEIVPRLERLAVEADAARIAAEAAEEACIAARQSVADCEEAAVHEPSPTIVPPPVPIPAGAGRPLLDDADEADEMAAAIASGEPLVVALLRGDRAALARAAAELGGDDATSRRTWTLELGRFLEAIVDRAIEAASLDFPTDHPFWGAFALAQNREIAAALASLGYRFDGLGGWLDGRVPSQRDLSLAVGYAGLDPMRIRRWPTEAEAGELYRDVRVAADEYLIAAAGGFTLGELISLLGRRADALTEIWNAWGRVRPVLLGPSR